MKEKYLSLPGASPDVLNSGRPALLIHHCSAQFLCCTETCVMEQYVDQRGPSFSSVGSTPIWFQTQKKVKTKEEKRTIDFCLNSFNTTLLLPRQIFFPSTNEDLNFSQLFFSNRIPISSTDDCDFRIFNSYNCRRPTTATEYLYNFDVCYLNYSNYIVNFHGMIFHVSF